MSMNDIKIGVKQLNNVSAEWGGNFCSVTSWHNEAGADITMTNIPTISLDNTQIYSLLAVLSNYVLVNNVEKPNCDFVNPTGEQQQTDQSPLPQNPPPPAPEPQPEPQPEPEPPKSEDKPKFIEPENLFPPPEDGGGDVGPDPGEDWKKKT